MTALGAVSSHRAVSVAWLPPLSAEKGDTEGRGNTAEIVTLPKAKFPPVADYARRCAALIRPTTPGPTISAAVEQWPETPSNEPWATAVAALWGWCQ